MAVQSFADLSAPAKAALGIFGISAVVLVFLAFRLFASLVTRLANALPTSGTKRSASKAKQEASQEDEKPRAGAGQPGVSLKQLQRRAKEAETAGRKSSAQHDERVTHHPLFVNTLRGHADTVNGVNFSPDGSVVATACEDQVVRLYNLGGDVTNRGITFRRVRCLRRPQAVAVGDTPNDMLLVLKGDVERPALCRMRHSKAGWEVLSEVDSIHGQDRMVSCTTSWRGEGGGHRLLLTTSHKRDLALFDIQGRKLGSVNPSQVQNYMAALSPGGRFIAAATWTADVKVWEVVSDKSTKEFKRIAKVMDLKGLKGGCLCLAFSPDSKRIATISKDGALRVWSLDVRYHLQEDPKSLLTVPLPQDRTQYAHLCWPPGGDTLVAAFNGTDLHFLDARTGKLVQQVEGAHEHQITALVPAPVKLPVPSVGACAVVASASEDHRVRLWRVPA